MVFGDSDSCPPVVSQAPSVVLDQAVGTTVTSPGAGDLACLSGMGFIVPTDANAESLAGDPRGQTTVLRSHMIRGVSQALDRR